VAAESLFATLFPSDCRLCGAALTEVSRLPVCFVCVGSIHRIAAKTCAVCGELVARAEGGPDEVRCGLCQRARLPFAKAVAYGSYDGALRGLIHLLKYERVRPAADALGRLLAEAMAGLKLAATEKAVVVVPVPLARGRERQRGFNQAEEIARAAVKHWGRRGAVAGETKTAQARAPVPHGPSMMELNTSALRRTRETQSQTGLTRHQRRANLRGAFVAARPEEIAGREIILVDDVYTTGTTAYECARVLRRAGAAEVYVATAARVLKGEAAAEEFEAATKAQA
jgi:predicted amidophosphoribosyltransferase